MKNVVTFETAKRLKEAGFPQPEPGLGQFWYNGDSTDLGVLCNCISANWKFTYSSVGEKYDGTDGNYTDDMLGCIFAPSATDILPDLICHDLGYYNDGDKEIWILFGLNMEEIAQNDNPAEAAAAAWLHLNEKK